jgi:hypothetical protein
MISPGQLQSGLTRVLTLKRNWTTAGGHRQAEKKSIQPATRFDLVRPALADDLSQELFIKLHC